MLKEILITDIKEKLNLSINNLKNRYLSLVDTDDKETTLNILNKEVLNVEDINDLLINYFPFELTNEELYALLKKDSTYSKKNSKKNIKEILKVLIQKYLINLKEYQDKIINMFYNIDLDALNKLDICLSDEYYSNNKEIIILLNKLSNVDNKKFQETSTKLKQIYNLSDDNLIPLINIFYSYEIPKYNNYYHQYQKIIDKLLTTKTTNPKEISLLLLLLIDDINLVKDINLTKKDLIDFITKLENNKIRLNSFQINKLLDNFRIKYLSDFNLTDINNELRIKIITSYDTFYNNNFYFKIEDFINYYNNLYSDNFASFCFSNEPTKLTRNIFDSIFYNNGINESVITLEKDLYKFKNFKLSIIDYKINCLEIDKVFYERYKFYSMYIDKVKDYLEFKDEITIEYYILKNIPSSDRGHFYELFKIYYGDVSKTLARNGHTITNVCKLIKKEYLEELENCEFKERYEVLNKYKNYCTYLKVLPHFSEKDLLNLMKEYEDKYYNPSPPKKKLKRK